MKIVLDRLPLPPSENECYLTRSGIRKKTGKFGTWRAPSECLEKYQEAMQHWRLQNIRIANQARDLLVAPLRTQQKPIRIDRYFAFRHDRIFTLAGTAKKLDASNRVKPLDDALCEHVLGMDDSWIWAGTATKLASIDEECCIVVMQHVEPMTLELARSGSSYGQPMVLCW